MRSTPAIIVCLLAAACDRRTESPLGPADETEAAESAPAAARVASTSIIRPEVAEEAGVPAPAEPLPPPPSPSLQTLIQFKGSGAKLNDTARARLNALMSEPQFVTGGTITLAGHSDSSGTDEDNLIMSRRRAEAVSEYLTSEGVAEERISIVALGERRPIEPNAHEDGSDYPEGRQLNRRVEITIAPPGVSSGATSLGQGNNLEDDR